MLLEKTVPGQWSLEEVLDGTWHNYADGRVCTIRGSWLSWPNEKKFFLERYNETACSTQVDGLFRFGHIVFLKLPS